MSRFVRALSALLLCLAASSAQAFVWFGDDRGLHRVDAAANVADLHAATADPVSVAIDPNDGAVWSVSRSRVSKFTKDGVLVFSRTLASYADNIGNGRKVVVNQPEATVWVAGERHVLRLARDGSLLAVLQGGGATDMQIQYGDSLWVLDSDRDELRHYNYDGSFVQRVNLGGASARARTLAIDDARGFLWLGADNALVQRGLETPSTVLRRVDTTHEANAISLDADTGELWVLGGHGFHGYRADGTRFKTEHLGNDGVNDPDALVFDSDAQALWIGHRRGVSRFTRAGARVATIPAGETGTIAVSRQEAYFKPMIFPYSLFGETVANTRPAIVFLYIAECSTYNCPFPPEFYATHSIVADLDGVDISSGFVFDPATGETRYVPPAPLAQGFHMVTARAVDADGRISEPAQLWFTVDTVGPSLVAISPPNGARVTTQPITVSGSFDSSAVSVTVPGGSQAGSSFSFQAPLVLGTNVFSLGATDELGNVSTVALTYTYDPPNAAPTVSITTPTVGQVFSPAPATIAVAANAADSDGTVVRVDFYRNGVLAGSATSAPFEASLTGVPPGLHNLQARATDDRGRVGFSAGVQVRVNAPPIVTLFEPVDGAVLIGAALIRAAISDPDGTIQRIEIVRDGVDVYVYPYNPPEIGAAYGHAGVHTYAVRATDNLGVTTTSPTVQVTVLPFTFDVVSPAYEATVQAGDVLFTGTFQGPADTTITVNGLPATLVFDASGYGGTYSVVVPLLVVGTVEVVAEMRSPSTTGILGFGRAMRVTVVP